MKLTASLRIATTALVVAAFVAALTSHSSAQDIPVRPGMVVVKLSQTAASRGALATYRPVMDVLASSGVMRISPFIPDAGVHPSGSTVAKAAPGRNEAEIARLEAEVARIQVIEYTSGEDPWQVSARLSAVEGVEYAEPWFLMTPLGGTDPRPQNAPNDSLYAQQAFLTTIKAAEAFSISEGSPSIVIAIADTDIKWDHPDLEANIWVNPGESGMDAQNRDKRSNGVDDDGNGLVDDWHGWDFAGASNSTPDNDTRSASGGHGTSVSGLVGAVTNNRIGIASIGNRCKILPLKVGPDAGGNLAFAYQAMDLAGRMGAKVFNASWGSFGYSQAGEDLVNLSLSRGMMIVGGAGNHGGIEPFYPAAYAGVLDAGVTDANDNIGGGSGYGPPVDVFTPGQGALSISNSGGYAAFGATSAAAPIASGLAGLVTEHFPAFTPAQVRERIRVTCDNIDAKNPTKAKFAGKGRINAFRALNDPPIPSLRIQSSTIIDPNNDRRLDPGEVAGVVVTLRNWLAPTGAPVTLTLTPVTNTASVSVTHGTVTIGAIATDATADNSTEPLTFTVQNAGAADAVVLFRVDITSGTYEDFDFVSASVNPSYQTMQSGALSVTVQANGQLGYKDYPTNSQGAPMMFGTTDLQLYTGSLMLGTDQGHIVSNARSAGNFLARDNDFRILDPVRIDVPGWVGRARAASRFDDAYADSARRLNVEVLHEMYDFSNRGVSDVLISRYTVKNIGTTKLTGLRAGLFMDFGGYPQYYIGTVGYDSLRHFGYVSKSGFPMVGTFVIDSLPRTDPRRSIFWAINNDPAAAGNPFGTLDGFTAAEKWRALATFAGNRTAPPGNVAYVITAPYADIEPGASAVFLFGHTSATLTQVMQARVDSAVAFWNRIPYLAVERVDDAVPAAATISVYPHPLEPGAAASITFTLPEATQVRIDLVSVLGTSVRLTEDMLEAGTHVLRTTLPAMPRGVYFLRLSSTGHSAITPVVIASH